MNDSLGPFSSLTLSRYTVQIVDTERRLHDWCDFFKVTSAELAGAVLAVGRNPALVRRYLQIHLARRA